MLAADVDPDANLGLALGMSQEEVDSIVPISKMRTLVEERTGANEANKFFKLNPFVSDIPEKYAHEVNGVKLLVMGTVDVGGSGCVCPEHVMLKALLSALTYRKDDVVIMDMEAGLEHLGRGTAANMDQFLVVVEPGRTQRPDLRKRQASCRRSRREARARRGQQGARRARRGVCPQRHPRRGLPRLHPLQSGDHGR